MIRRRRRRLGELDPQPPLAAADLIRRLMSGETMQVTDVEVVDSETGEIVFRADSGTVTRYTAMRESEPDA